MRRFSAIAVGAALLTFAAAGDASAEEIHLGVFLPQASFATNAERNDYAQRLAERLTSAAGGGVTFAARAFTRRSDLISFVNAGRVDVLVTDGLLLVDVRGEVIAHATREPAVALYGAPGATMVGLRGRVVAAAEVGADDGNFYANTALAGEVAPEQYFDQLRASGTTAAAFDAVRSRAADAAFGPDEHPAAEGLQVLARGGRMPIAAVAVLAPDRVGARIRGAIVGALEAGAGVAGGIPGWRGGAGTAIERARTLARTRPRVVTAQPLLTPAPEDRLTPPPLRLSTQAPPPAPSAPRGLVVAPTLAEP